MPILDYNIFLGKYYTEGSVNLKVLILVMAVKSHLWILLVRNWRKLVDVVADLLMISNERSPFIFLILPTR